ncbi:MAG: 2,3-bisphosphoglycerate-independent phosphoglycerate mutase [Chitinophagaceae bacterium]|nr:2,3-bisphosphoglycerate-independent phosphoglycerate mutase [Chitinophagaceae bacterium]
MNKKVILIILDGWGIATKPQYSAIDNAKTPFINSLYKTYPHSKLEASGLSVGLPDGQMGNSEVGHMNIGAGRIVYQDLVKINLEIENGGLENNPILQNTFQYVKKKNTHIHIMGLVSDGGVHSHIHHLKSLISYAHKANITKIFIHAFTDGRDTDPKSGQVFLEDLENHLRKTTGEIASITGRFFAMDRDKRWERIKKAYDALVKGVGVYTTDVLSEIKKAYSQNITDEFIEPIIKVDSQNNPIGKIYPNDAVIFCNFRTDRGRELTEVLTQKDFPDFEMKKIPLHYVTMTSYDDTFQNVSPIYRKDNLNNTLGEIIALHNKKQIRIAETEKYPHVTFFFSGGRETPFTGEQRIMCPSPKVKTYDLKPEMSAAEITHSIIPELIKKEADFICLNFANPDMVGHTGVFSAAITACETVDKCTEAVVQQSIQNGYSCVIIADHGNCDIMINEDGSPNTAHTTNLVPCIIIDKDITKPLKNGKLCDIAPTILKIMNIPAPFEMTGNPLF